MTAQGAYAVAIVTHDSAAELAGCLAAVARLDPPPAELALVDCASRDASARLAVELAPAGPPLRQRALAENRGYAGGMNVALALTSSPFVLALNPDARPAPGFAAELLAAMARPGWRVGAATGRLLRLQPPGEPRRLDACGMRLTLTWRHLDRGSGELDRGQWPATERVFGGTGAACLYRRAALADVALDGAVFAEEFHSFREDAELAFRLRERGWECLYEPRAEALHRRTNLPERRSAMPAQVNLHSLKNRYLLRAYHQTAGNLALTLVPSLWRDLLALGHVLLREPGSRAAYAWLARHRRFILARRRIIQARRTVSAATVDRWFLRQGMPP